MKKSHRDELGILDKISDWQTLTSSAAAASAAFKVKTKKTKAWNGNTDYGQIVFLSLVRLSSKTIDASVFLLEVSISSFRRV